MNELAWGVILILMNPQAQGPASAQGSRPQGARNPSEWVTEWRVRGDVRYNSNVWLLDDRSQDRLGNRLLSFGGGGQQGGTLNNRYDDMESVDDFIFTPDVRFHAAGPSPLGKRLSFWLDAEYDAYIVNSRRSHFETDFGIGHYVGPDGHLNLSVKFIPMYFERNFLADGVDANGDSSISSSERVYDGGTYMDWDLGLEYRHRIVDRTKQQPLGLDGLLAVGYRDRSYDSPFRSHDGAGPWTQLAFRFEYGPGLKWGVRYKVEFLESPTRREVKILDEPDFGVDFNGNGTATDINARAFENVDRSRREHEIGLTLGVDLSPTVEVDLSYTLTLRDYESGEPYDVSYRNRQDTRNDFGVSLKNTLSKAADLRVGLQYRMHDTNRPSDPDITADAYDYTRFVFFLALTYRW